VGNLVDPITKDYSSEDECLEKIDLTNVFSVFYDISIGVCFTYDVYNITAFDENMTFSWQAWHSDVNGIVIHSRSICFAT